MKTHMTFLASLIALDHALFAKINHDWTNGFLDWLMPAITDLHKSAGFFIALLPLLALWCWKQKSLALRVLLALVLSIGLADMISYRAVKKLVQRDRPEFAGLATPVQLRTHQHSGTSFPSNHAANIFAAAQVMTLAIPIAGPAFYLIAFAVGYSRIYVGVHFPLDVIVGALLGIVIATLVWRLLIESLKRRKKKEHP